MKQRHLFFWQVFVTLLGWLLQPAASSAETYTRDYGGEIGFELQVYPTGVIPGVRFETDIDDFSTFHLRLGAQTIRHQDFGVHDDERGNGVGASIGYKRYRKLGYEGFSWSLRSDLWFNTLDWTDNPGTTDEVSGTTDVLVLQPTVELSWLFLPVSNLFVTPSFSAGFEINIQTEGEEVGQGFIYILGLTIGRRF